LVHNSADIIKQCESDSNIKDNSTKSRHSSLIKSLNSSFFESLDKTIKTTFILMSLQTLHFGFDNINRSISEHRSSTCHSSSNQHINHIREHSYIRHQFLAIFINQEPNCLVTALFNDSRIKSFITS